MVSSLMVGLARLHVQIITTSAIEWDHDIIFPADHTTSSQTTWSLPFPQTIRRSRSSKFLAFLCILLHDLLRFLLARGLQISQLFHVFACRLNEYDIGYFNPQVLFDFFPPLLQPPSSEQSLLLSLPLVLVCLHILFGPNQNILQTTVVLHHRSSPETQWLWAL